MGPDFFKVENKQSRGILFTTFNGGSILGQMNSLCSNLEFSSFVADALKF